MARINFSIPSANTKYLLNTSIEITTFVYDPLERTAKLQDIAFRNNERRYYRFRPAKWYGGIVTGDVAVCNLLCAFCWAGDDIRNHPEKVGKYYSPEQAFNILDSIGKKFGFRQIRLSGQEPTIGREHLLELLKLVDKTSYRFILETNGILIGAEKDYAQALSRFRNLHVRVSLKGTNKEEFTLLTKANPNGFELQISALENLIEANVKCHPAVMVSFSSDENLRKLKARLSALEPSLEKNLEIEELILYPHVVERLKRMGIVVDRGYEPGRVPEELI